FLAGQSIWLSLRYAAQQTFRVDDQRINNFLEQTYQNSSKMDCQPSLLLITSLSGLDPTKQTAATMPPISSFTSPFIGTSSGDAAKMLQSVAAPNIVDSNLFAVLDERSLYDDSGLIVRVKDGVVDHVRVHFDTINTELIHIQVMTGDIAETNFMAGEGGVFRVRSDGSKKGGPAPRKKLGG
ncbi:unnamed protein product, partial [Aureobasidium uvarum]